MAAPTLVLNTPTAMSTTTARPTLEMTGTDADGDRVRYNVQIATDAAFTTGLLDRTSGTDTGFASQDTFDDGVFSTSKWTRDSSTQVVEGNQRLEMSSIPAGNYVKLASNHYYDMTGRSASLRVVDAGDQALTSWQNYPLILAKDANNTLFFQVIDGQLSAKKTVAGASSALMVVAYSPSAHQYLRIRESAGTTYWETSGGGVTWTTLVSQLNPISVASLRVEILVGTWQAARNLFNSALISTSFELTTATTGWAGSTNVSALASFAHPGASHGTRAMFVKATAAGGTVGVITSGFHPCTAGLAYTFGFQIMTTLNVQCFVNWYNSAGTYLSASGAGLGAPAGGDARLTFKGAVAPAGATQLKFLIEVLSVPANGDYYLDAVQYEQATAPTYSTQVVADVTSDADWIMTARLNDGAICQYPDKVYIVPYFANLAALGLARATEVTGNQSYATASWNWLDWYAAHMNPTTGFVTDYNVAPTTQALTSTGDFDSTDSYAGTFLHTTWKTWKVTGNTTRLSALGAALGKAVAAIEATQEPDGLTWSKPSYRVKYLMDQVEAYAGLQAAYELAGVLGDAPLRARALTAAQAMATGVESMWDATTESYYWARHENGTHEVTNWSKVYPDAWAQVWAVAFDLARGQRAIDLVNRYNAEHPQWDQPTATNSNGVGTVGYQPVPGWAFMQVGQTARSQTAATRIRSAAMTANRAWPFSAVLAGELIVLESTDRSYLAPGAAPYGEGASTTAKVDNVEVTVPDLYGSGDQVGYTVPTALAGGTYYWRARASDPAGSNTWSAFTASRTFTVSATAGTAPTVALNTATGFNYGEDRTPTVEFTGSDADGDPLNYEIQISSNSAFDGTGVLLTRNSVDHLGFKNTLDDLDVFPFTAGQKSSYTVRTADALNAGGTYWWRVRVVDPGGSNVYSSYTAARTFTVTPAESQSGGFFSFFRDARPKRRKPPPVAGVPPVASFTWAADGLAATFNNSGSSDADGTIVRWSWNFGDSPTSQVTSGQPITHNYGSSGDYTARLTVTDNDGRTDTATAIVSVVTSGGGGDSGGGVLYLTDSFNVTTSQDLAPAAGLTTAAPFRFLGPNNTYGWRNVHRPANQGNAGIVVGGTRGGVALPKRVENRSASGASYIGVDIGKIPTRWEIDFAFDPGVVGPWKMGFHFWDSYSDVGETVPGHFSCRFRGWDLDAGNVSGSGPALSSFGSNRDGLGDSTGSHGNWPNGDLDPYDGTSRTIYTLTIEHVGGNTLRFTFPPQTGQVPITLTDNRLEEITAKGVCVCLWENFRSLSTASRDFMTGMRFQTGQVGQAGRPAKPANDVYKAWGINTHFSYLAADSEWKETATAVSWLQTLGVGAVRQLLPRNTAGRNAIISAANQLGAGVKWLFPTLTVEEVTSLDQARGIMNDQLNWLVANFPLDRIRGFPGVNEANGGDAALAPEGWANKARWAQQAIYEETRKRPAFNHVQIQGPPLNMKGGQNQVPAAVAELGDLSAWLDWGDAHIYPADDDPEVNVASDLAMLEPLHPGKPVAVTEGGYSTSTTRGYTGGSKLTAETEAGLYAPKHLLVHAVAGRQFYTYELLDGAPPYVSTERETREAGFGLVRVPSLTTSTWTAKPGFNAMRRLLALFKDPTPHIPQGLVVDVTGPADLRQGLYQKANGQWLLAVWRAVDLWAWDTATQTGTALAVPSRTVSVTFDRSRPVKVYEPSVQDLPTRDITVSTFTINLSKGLQVCEIGGGGGSGGGGGGGGGSVQGGFDDGTFAVQGSAVLNDGTFSLSGPASADDGTF